jgi:DNA-binding NtrC family response regulator
LSDILRLEGYNVVAVASGEAAVEHLRNYSVDLMIVDLKMPGMNGLDVVQVANQLALMPKLSCLRLMVRWNLLLRRLRQRVHDYLLKPASPTQIIESVKRGLERRAARMAQDRLKCRMNLLVKTPMGLRLT